MDVDIDIVGLGTLLDTRRPMSGTAFNWDEWRNGSHAWIKTQTKVSVDEL
jgi:hypothetical protein